MVGMGTPLIGRGTLWWAWGPLSLAGGPCGGHGDSSHWQGDPVVGMGTPLIGRGTLWWAWGLLSLAGGPCGGHGDPFHWQGDPVVGMGTPLIGRGTLWWAWGLLSLAGGPCGGHGDSSHWQGDPVVGMGTPLIGRGTLWWAWGLLSLAGGPCAGHGDRVVGMGTMWWAWGLLSLAGGPCGGYGDPSHWQGDPVVGMGTMWWAWGPCGGHGDPSHWFGDHHFQGTGDHFNILTSLNVINPSPPLPSPLLQDPSYSAIKYGDVKRVTYDSIYGQGVVYNVIAMDTTSQATSAYIPRATYACDFYSAQGCSIQAAMIDKVLSPLVGLAGLFLCFLGHHFFDVG